MLTLARRPALALARWLAALRWLTRSEVSSPRVVAQLNVRKRELLDASSHFRLLRCCARVVVLSKHLYRRRLRTERYKETVIVRRYYDLDMYAVLDYTTIAEFSRTSNIAVLVR